MSWPPKINFKKVIQEMCRRRHPDPSYSMHWERWLRDAQQRSLQRRMTRRRHDP